ncbi:hypothetical protein ACHAPD_001711 [Fusarium lateritium]
MDKSSIDGRRKNKNAAAPQVRLLRKSDTETPASLRPASPPKSNPWSSTKKAPETSLAGMFPPLPKPQSSWSPEKMSTAEASREPSTLLNESRLGYDMIQPALSIKSFSPVSNSSSTTRQLFEAAAPRATENTVEKQELTAESLWKTPSGADVLTALEVIVREQPQKLMVPMRLAMASILDAMLFWLARQPLFVSELKSSWWKIMQMSMPDIAEYKRLCRSPGNYNSPLPSEMALREMFEEMKPGHERKTAKSVATQTGDIPENTVSVGDPRYYFPIVHRERRVSL